MKKFFITAATFLNINSGFYLWSNIIKKLALAVFMAFSPASYSEYEIIKQAANCSFALYDITFRCPTLDDAFKGCVILQSVYYPDIKYYECSLNPFANRVEYHDYRSSDWFEVRDEFQYSFWFAGTCSPGGTFNPQTGKCKNPIVILDPGHGLLLDEDGTTLHYQRPATPTFALHEDDLTLSIASAAKSQLEKNNYTVYLTREGSLAPITEVGGIGCGAPKYDYCNDDLRMRVDIARNLDRESDSGSVFISIHTNGSNIPLVGGLKNGTESYFCSGDRDYSPLAKSILDGIVALGTNNLGIYDGCDKGVLMRMSESNIPNSLVEVAYHSNTFKIPGPTDEERLNDPTFRTSAGNAIATAIDQFIVDVLDGGK